MQSVDLERLPRAVVPRAGRSKRAPQVAGPPGHGAKQQGALSRFSDAFFGKHSKRHGRHGSRPHGHGGGKPGGGVAHHNRHNHHR